MTDDERAGVDWWNALTEDERAAWMLLAGSAVPADAWSYFKAHPPVRKDSSSTVTLLQSQARTSHP